MSSRRTAAATILAVTMALAACGGAASIPPSATPQPDVVSVACVDSVGPFVEALQDLNSRLNVGLNQAAYSEKVGDVRVAYDRIDWTEVEALCITQVGKPAEDAFNAYVRANSAWSKCLQARNCNYDKVRPRLQKEWASATELLDAIEKRLPD